MKNKLTTPQKNILDRLASYNEEIYFVVTSSQSDKSWLLVAKSREEGDTIIVSVFKGYLNINDIKKSNDNIISVKELYSKKVIKAYSDFENRVDLVKEYYKTKRRIKK